MGGFIFPQSAHRSRVYCFRSRLAMQLASISGVLYSRARVLIYELTNAVRTPTWHKRVAT